MNLNIPGVHKPTVYTGIIVSNCAPSPLSPPPLHNDTPQCKKKQENTAILMRS